MNSFVAYWDVRMEPVNVGFLWFLENIIVSEISWNHFSHPPWDETENH